MVAIIPGKAYVLTSVSSGHALDLSGGDKQSVLVFNKHGNGNQQVSRSFTTMFRMTFLEADTGCLG